ncbi:MAG: hypothetical protein ACYDHH_33630 [Solirubrobacteraceae bacterium]
MHHMTFQRFCAWSGMACVILFFAAFAIADFIPPLAPHSSAVSIAHFYREHATRIRIGGVVMFLSGMFYAVFTGVISAQMRRIPGIHRSVIYVQLAAGAFACVTFLLPALLFIVTAFRPERSPEITQTLNDMSWIILVMPWPPFMAQNYAFAYAIFTDPQERKLFPRWLAYVNIWAPIVFSPAILLPFFKVGPFDWRGIFVFWLPGTVFTIQFIVNVAMLLKAIDREQAETAAEPSGPDPRTLGAVAVGARG